MAVAQDDLLTIACVRIRDLDRPACIKNSDLRYVAVNRAYAAFYGIGIGEFAGRRSGDLFAPEDGEDRQQKEWRALVFGTEETAICADPFGAAPHAMLVERFLSGDDTAFVFSVFLAAPLAEDKHAAFVVDDGSARQPGDHLRGARVLAVTADARDRNAIADLLCRWSMDGCAVEDAGIALAVLHSAFDLGVAVDCLVIGECREAGSLIECVRQERRFDGLPIIALGSPTNKELAVTAYLETPVPAAVLFEAVLEALRPMCSARTSPAASRARLDVLVAEDNAVHQVVFTQILRQTGLDFMIVADGLQAVDAWERCRPRVILMDILLPVISGFQATRQIRERERKIADGRHVPIIGMTSYPPEVDRSLCLDAGMDDQLAKPVSPDALNAKIGRWLDHAPGRIGVGSDGLPDRVRLGRRRLGTAEHFAFVGKPLAPLDREA